MAALPTEEIVQNSVVSHVSMTTDKRPKERERDLVSISKPSGPALHWEPVRSSGLSYWDQSGVRVATAQGLKLTDPLTCGWGVTRRNDVFPTDV